MNEHDVGRIFGSQLRAGKPAQANNWPITFRRARGIRAAISRWLRRYFGA